MINRAINPFLLVVAFLILTALYYWLIILVDKSVVYGFVYGIARAIVIFSGFGYFWMLTEQVPVLNNAKRKINLDPSSRNKGGIAITLTLGIIHMVLVYFGAEMFNQYLLSTSGKLTKGIIKDCRQARQNEYCLYQYMVNSKSYQVQLINKQKKYKEQDIVTVIYYPKLPIISIIKE